MHDSTRTMLTSSLREEALGLGRLSFEEGSHYNLGLSFSNSQSLPIALPLLPQIAVPETLWYPSTYQPLVVDSDSCASNFKLSISSWSLAFSCFSISS